MKPRKPGKIHAARIEKSRRLKQTLQAINLYDHPTTKLIANWTGSTAVRTDIAELRANGFNIKCTCIRRGRFEYRLVGDRR
jgi:precorrin-6B methylase 2